MQKYTVVSMGEPAGNSPEMIIRAVRNLAGDPSVWLIVTGDEGVFRKAAADFSLPLPFTYYADDEESLGEAEAGGESLIFYSTSSIDMDSFSFGQVSAETGRASYESLRKAVEIIQNGYAHSLVTTAVSEEALKSAGYSQSSVYELLGVFASSARLMDMIKAGPLNIFGISHRRSIRSALEMVKRENIISALVEIDSIMASSYFDRSKPIAVAALNPRRSDGTWSGPEEDDAIIPAVEVVRKLGINAVGPLPAEDIFADGVDGEYSSILVMTAGTGLAAAAAASPKKASIITWGLPFMHVEPLIDAGIRKAEKGGAPTERLEAAIALALVFRSASLMA